MSSTATPSSDRRGSYGDGVAWLLGFVGVTAVIAAIREWRIRSLEARHDPDATP